MKTSADDTVNVAPFVDDKPDDENKESVDDDAKTKDDAVEGDSPEGIQAENQMQNDSSDDSADSNADELLSKIEDVVLDKFKEFLSSETEKVDATDDDDKESDGDDTERTSAMSYSERKVATGTDGKPSDTALNPADVVDNAPKTGIDFDTVKEVDRQKDKSTEPGSSFLGDNFDGSTINPGDIDYTNTPVSKPDNAASTASTASVMKLVDQYIKAGVINESKRFDTIASLASLSPEAVKNQSLAIASIIDANKRRSEEMAAVARSAKMNRHFADDSTDDADDQTDDADSVADDLEDEDGENTAKNKDKSTSNKTCALIDMFGTAKATVARKSAGRFIWRTASRSGTATDLTKAIAAASKASGTPLVRATDKNIEVASRRRKANRRAKIQAHRAQARRAAAARRNRSAKVSRKAAIRNVQAHRAPQIQRMRTPSLTARTSGANEPRIIF